MFTLQFDQTLSANGILQPKPLCSSKEALFRVLAKSHKNEESRSLSCIKLFIVKVKVKSVCKQTLCLHFELRNL